MKKAKESNGIETKRFLRDEWVSRRCNYASGTPFSHRTKYSECHPMAWTHMSRKVRAHIWSLFPASRGIFCNMIYFRAAESQRFGVNQITPYRTVNDQRHEKSDDSLTTNPRQSKQFYVLSRNFFTKKKEQNITKNPSSILHFRSTLATETIR